MAWKTVVFCALIIVCSCAEPRLVSAPNPAAGVRATEIEQSLAAWREAYGDAWSPSDETDTRFTGDHVLVTDLLKDIDDSDAAAARYRASVLAFIRGLSPADQQALKAALVRLSAAETGGAVADTTNVEAATDYLRVSSLDPDYVPEVTTHHFIDARDVAGGGHAFEVLEFHTSRGVAPPALPTAALNEFYREGTRMNFVLTRDVLYCRRSTGDLFLVPAGFITDFASVPEAARVFLPQTAQEAGPAILHDWLYAISALGSRNDQHFADTILVEELNDAHAGQARRALFRAAVENGGHGAVGQPSELRFATAATANIGRHYAGAARNAIVGRTDCKTFADNYFALLRRYGTGGAVDIYQVYEDRSMRDYVRAVISGRGPPLATR